MKAFDYARPSAEAEAKSTAGRAAGARFIAGGTLLAICSGSTSNARTWSST
ncbi:MAG: hypothetical protein WDO74_07115 [Pseudomonadota bacterium]